MGFSEFPSLLAYFTDFSIDILNSVAAEVSKCDVTWDESQYDDIQRNTALQHCYGQLQDCFNIAILSCEKIVVTNCPLSIKSIIEVL